MRISKKLRGICFWHKYAPRDPTPANEAAVDAAGAHLTGLEAGFLWRESEVGSAFL